MANFPGNQCQTAHREGDFQAFAPIRLAQREFIDKTESCVGLGDFGGSEDVECVCSLLIKGCGQLLQR